MTNQEYITLSEAAKRWGVSVVAVRKWVRKGRLPQAELRTQPRPTWVVPADTPSPRVARTEITEIAGYASVNQMAARWDRAATTISQWCRYGWIEGAKKSAGRTGQWYIPVDAPLPQRAAPPPPCVRCDCCGILLSRSGDAKHPNDRPDAGRCWSCREDYGEN